MNNKEIRARALAKMKNKIAGLTAIVMVAFIIDNVLGLFSNMTGSVLDVLLSVMVRVITSLLMTGLAKVSMQAWREGNALWSDLFIAFRTRRYLLCGLYGGMISASFSVVGNLVYMLGGGLAANLLDLVLGWAGTACTAYIVFAADLFEKKNPLDAAKMGISCLTKNLKRVIGMEFVLYCWIGITVAIMFAFFAILGGVVGLPLRLVLFVVLGIIRWAVGGYIVLSEAGLGRTLLKG